MKKILLLALIVPLLGVTKKPLEKPFYFEKRPTLEQELQLSRNELKRINSRIDLKLVEFNNNKE